MGNTRLIIGLGNPGRKYQKTRHNLGFRVVDFLVTFWKGKLINSDRWQGIVPVKVYKSSFLSLVLVKPFTYVNLSGPAIKELMLNYGIKPEEILVISDDFSLPFGTIRIRQAGSAGGHKGLESIITALGTRGFPRLRIGCGPLPQGVNPKDYVLLPFARKEENKLNLLLTKIGEAVNKICTEGLEKTMSLYNKKSLLTFSENIKKQSIDKEEENE